MAEKFAPTLKELFARANAAEERVLVLEWVLEQLRALMNERELRVGDRIVGTPAITHVMADLQDLLERYSENARMLWGSRSLLVFPEEGEDENNGGKVTDS